MIRAALAARYRVHATAANLNNLVGVPLTILSTPEDTEALVVEAGASVPGRSPGCATSSSPHRRHHEHRLRPRRRLRVAGKGDGGEAVAARRRAGRRHRLGPETMWPEARRRTLVIPAPCRAKATTDALLDRYLDKDGHPASHWTPARR